MTDNDSTLAEPCDGTHGGDVPGDWGDVSLRIFPLHGILPGPACACALGAACKSIGKHPMVRWRSYEGNTKGPSGGYGIQTGRFNGIFVVDLDVTGGKNGPGEFERLAAGRPIPETSGVLTPSGGGHFYYQNPPDVFIRTSHGVLAPGVDIKGEGGFVVGPGSPHKNGGTYQEVPGPLAYPPAWLLELVSRQPPAPRPLEDTHRTVEPTSLEGVRAVEWAKGYLRRAEPSIEGQGGSDRLFAACCHLMYSALPLGVLQQIVEEVYNPRCEPPWSPEEIAHKLTDADRRFEEPRGLHSPDFFDRLRGAARVANDATRGDGAAFRPHGEEVDLGSRVVPVSAIWLTEKPPPREYVARDARTGRGALGARGVCLLVAAGGVGKSYATVALALAVASDTPWLGVVRPEHAGRILIVSAEEPADELRRRLYFVALACGVRTVPDGAIDIVDVHDVHVPLLDAEGSPTEHAKALVALANDRGPYALVIVDPLARVAGAAIDADNVAAAALISTLESISSAARGLVLGVHHTDKAARRAAIVDATAVRGATGLGDSARMTLVLSLETLEQLEDERLKEIVTLACVKANTARRWDPIELRRGEHGELIPLAPVEIAVVAGARTRADPAAARRATKEAERAAKQETEAAARAVKTEAATKRTAEIDAAVLAVVGGRPGIGTTDLRAAVRAAANCGSDLADVAIARLVGNGNVLRGGTARAVRHYLPGDENHKADQADIKSSDSPGDR